VRRVGTELGEGGGRNNGGSQEAAATLYSYDIPTSAPVGRCSARKSCLYFRNFAISVVYEFDDD